MDFSQIRKAAEGYGPDMTAFLRAIVRNPGESADEKNMLKQLLLK